MMRRNYSKKTHPKMRLLIIFKLKKNYWEAVALITI